MGENLLGADIECEDRKDPYGYYKALACKKISSDEDIGVALKKAKKGFFGLGRHGKSNNKIFTALKSWFYGGFKKRAKLSKCRISSTGHKLPEKWELMVERIIDRVAQK